MPRHEHTVLLGSLYISRALEINPHVSLIKRHISHLPHVSAAGRARKSQAEPQSQGEPERAKACKAHGDTKTEARRDRKRALVKSGRERASPGCTGEHIGRVVPILDD